MRPGHRLSRVLRRGSAAVVAVVVAALLPADRAGTDGPVRTSAVDPAQAIVRIDTARLCRAVPHAFLGLSTEWDSVVAYAGPAGRRRGALRALLAPLVRETHGLALPVGGDTADPAWWNPGARPRPVRLPAQQPRHADYLALK